VLLRDAEDARLNLAAQGYHLVLVARMVAAKSHQLDGARVRLYLKIRRALRRGSCAYPRDE
jgi:hypothetical protein